MGRRSAGGGDRVAEAKDSPLLGANWKDNNYRIDHSLYWHAGRPVTFAGNLSLSEWREQRGQDIHSLIADPGFKGPSHGDFRLPPDSPALSVGFEPFDATPAGRRRPIVLTAELQDIPPGFPAP